MSASLQLFDLIVYSSAQLLYGSDFNIIESHVIDEIFDSQTHDLFLH